MKTDVERLKALELALRKARPFVADRAEHEAVTPGFQEYAQELLREIDAAMERPDA